MKRRGSVWPWMQQLRVMNANGEVGMCEQIGEKRKNDNISSSRKYQSQTGK